MLFGWSWFDWTILIVIPGFLLTLWAQFKVKSTFSRYTRDLLPTYMTGAAVARRMLDANGLSHIPVEIVRGHLSDHYDPRRKVLRLSEAVYHGNNVAAVGVAAHEAGHALQDARGYVPLRFRIALVPVCNIGSNLAMPLFFIGLLMAGLSVFADWTVVVVGLVYILARSIGKYFGANGSARLTKADPNVIKYLGITLLPQAGVALGMATKAIELGPEGEIVRNITLFAVLVYEIVGPFLTKIALSKAGDIKSEGRRSAREEHLAKKAGQGGE